MVEREAGTVGCVIALILNGVQVPTGDAGLEDEAFVSLGDAASVVYDDQGAVPAGPQGRGDIDVAGVCVAGVTEELEESVLDRPEASGSATDTFGPDQASEAFP